ncbi:MAG: hypothetical protein Fur0028_09240 [Bacteroidales bacterium]
MKKIILFVMIIVFILSNSKTYSQDSLHLVATFVGTSSDPLVPDILTRNPYEINLGDINNDGMSDFVIHSNSGRYFSICKGDSPWNGNRIKIQTPEGFPQGYSNVTGIGDINGDGYDDFAIAGSKDYLYYIGMVDIFLGGDSIDLIPDFSFTRHYTIWDFLSFGSSGDFNNDGYQDFLIRNHYIREQEKGEAYLFKGGNILSNHPYKTFKGNSNVGFFSENSIFCDINGDNFDDILITESFLPYGIIPPIPKLYIFYGGNEIKDSADVVIDLGMAPQIFDLHDVNNDGYEDFMLMTSSGYPKLFLGSSNFDPNSFIQFSNYDLIMSFGYGIGYLGDINNDGFDDFGINIENYKNSKGEMVGKLNIYLGGKEIDTIPDFSLMGETHWSDYGEFLGALGDINGDGYNEFFVCATSYPNRNEMAGKIYIYSMKKFIVGVEESNDNIPIEYLLSQNYPNPFNPTTTIEFSIPDVGTGLALSELKVYDMLGREVATLVNEQKSPGNYEVKFDGSNLASGVYFYQLRAGEFSQTKKLILIK